MSTDRDDDTDTSRITRKGQVTIPKRLREKYGLEPGEEVRWIDSDDGITVRKASGSAGRGMLVDDEVSEEKREAMAKEMERTIREKRRTEWNPE